jgi:hypothetical protein
MKGSARGSRDPIRLENAAQSSEAYLFPSIPLGRFHDLVNVPVYYQKDGMAQHLWKNMPPVITCSCGMIGSARRGFQVRGADDNHRAVFFGCEGDTSLGDFAP